MFNTYPAMMQTYLHEAVVNSFQIAQEFCFSCLQQLIIYLLEVGRGECGKHNLHLGKGGPQKPRW